MKDEKISVLNVASKESTQELVKNCRQKSAYGGTTVFLIPLRVKKSSFKKVVLVHRA
jgi:hypothetical protein